MINKLQAGKRISALRKSKGLSQTEFAEKLGISPQAVSKWETGQALPDVEILLEMSHITQTSINEILEGDNLIYRIANRPYEMKDIALFVPEDERDYNDEWAKELINGKWVKRNWDAQKNVFEAQRNKGKTVTGPEKERDNWEAEKKLIESRISRAKTIIDHGGCILEIGAGPGGGNMPTVLLEKEDANIIISDLSPTVLREWKKLFDKELNPPYVSYAALDNCDLPFNDNSIDVVSDAGGFANTEGDKYKCLNEIYRVLKPGGMFISGDGHVTQETLKQLPEHAQKVLMERHPDLFENFYDTLVAVGFKTINNQMAGTWSTKNDESTIADLARELGIEVVFTNYQRCCIK